MNKLQENLISIDLTEEFEILRQASRSHPMHKSGVREATKDVMDYLVEQGLLCPTRGLVKAKKHRERLCVEDRESGMGRDKCGELHNYLNNIYYTGKTRFFKE